MRYQIKTLISLFKGQHGSRWASAMRNYCAKLLTICTKSIGPGSCTKVEAQRMTYQSHQLWHTQGKLMLGRLAKTCVSACFKFRGPLVRRQVLFVQSSMK